jgi:hypothetical protein
VKKSAPQPEPGQSSTRILTESGVVGNIIYYTTPKEDPRQEGPPPQNGRSYRLPTEGLAQIAHKFNSMIVKDCDNNESRWGQPACVMVQPGEGMVDFAEVLRVLVRAGFSGPLCIEKVPGKSVADVTTNMAAAGEFSRQLVRGATAPSLRVLVLGGTKFVGRALVEQALSEGHVVTVSNRESTSPTAAELCE